MIRATLSAVVLAMLACAPVAAKRAGPKPVAPVVIGHVRYEAPPWAKAAGQDQNGGVVVARDVATGAELWAAKVYTIPYDAGLEGDVQDIFIVDLQPSSDGKSLRITDEDGRHWRLDLASHRATADPAP